MSDQNHVKPGAPRVGLYARDRLVTRVLEDLLRAEGYCGVDLALEGGTVILDPGSVILCAEDVSDAIRLGWSKNNAVVIQLQDMREAVSSRNGPQTGQQSGPENKAGQWRLGRILSRLRLAHVTDSRAASGVFTFGPFQLDLAQMVLHEQATGRQIVLTEKERDILARLHREKGRPLDRKILLEDVWGYAAAVETHTLETHIYRLRQKIEADPAEPVLLVTDGVGYRLVSGLEGDGFPPPA